MFSSCKREKAAIGKCSNLFSGLVLSKCETECRRTDGNTDGFQEKEVAQVINGFFTGKIYRFSMAYDIITGIQHNDQRVDHEY